MRKLKILAMTGVGIIVVVTAVYLYKVSSHGGITKITSVANAPSGFSTAPASGPEGTVVTASFPETVTIPAGSTLSFYDAGPHGFYPVNNGSVTYMAYDAKTGLTYKTPAETTSGAGGKSVSGTVPQGICGMIVQSDQAPMPPPKVLTVTVLGPDGNQVPGTKPASFQLVCDKYTLSIKLVSSADPVLPDGVDSSSITATLSVKGPAQYVNGVRVKPAAPKIILTTPLGNTDTLFTTDLGTLVPTPSHVITDSAGRASVTITSADAGIASVRATALGIGDAKVLVHFKPKITGVKEDFVEPNSPTNFQLTTVPANPKDLTVDWKIIYPAGPQCGSLTGAATGMGLTKNGYYHGPTDSYPDGCDQTYEFQVKIQVTVTDKDGQTDTKTFSARGLEGQGLVKLP